MLRPVTTLLWEISRRRRGSAIALLGILLFGLLFKLALPFATETGHDLLVNVSAVLMAASIVCVLAICNFTEASAEKGWSGFPYRLFTLPISTLALVAAPVVFGIFVMCGVCGFWSIFIFTRASLPEPGWLTLLLVAFMVFFQTVLWCLAAFRIGRMLAIGLAGPGFVFLGFLPWQILWSTTWFSVGHLSVLVCGLILLSFGLAWFCVSRQRHGGGYRTNWLRGAIEKVSDALPRRKSGFSSPAAAQIWFEWRRCGVVLPLCVGGMLVAFIFPLSRSYQADANATLRLLVWTLATPVILAAVVGKGFSQPDFWSTDLACPSFSSVLPLASGQRIVVKLKIAALSAVLSWFLVAVFLCLWLPGWADLDALNMLRVGYWMAFHHSMWAQYLIAVLIVAAGILMTWKCLVDGLWAGLSGSWRRHLAMPLTFGLLFAAGMIALAVMVNHDAAVRAWYRADPNRPLSWLEQIAALAVIVKFLLASRSWRNIAPHRARAYFFLWLAATLILLALAGLFWADGLFALVLVNILDGLPMDPTRLFGLLVLLALLAMPLVRIGLAPSSLTRNRHRP